MRATLAFTAGRCTESRHWHRRNPSITLRTGLTDRPAQLHKTAATVRKAYLTLRFYGMTDRRKTVRSLIEHVNILRLNHTFPAQKPTRPPKIDSLSCHAMNVIVNDETVPLTDPCHVRQLLVQLKLTDGPCAVEVNRQLVPKRDHETHQLAEGDRIEIVTLVGGG